MDKVKQGKVTEVTVVLGSGVRSRKLRQDLKVIARRNNIDKAHLASKLMKHVVHQRIELGVEAKIKGMIVEIPKFKTGELMAVRVDGHTKERMTQVSINNHLTKTQLYSNLLNIAIANAKKDPEWLNYVITSVDPIDPWPNGKLKKELK